MPPAIVSVFKACDTRIGAVVKIGAADEEVICLLLVTVEEETVLVLVLVMEETALPIVLVEELVPTKSAALVLNRSLTCDV